MGDIRDVDPHYHAYSYDGPGGVPSGGPSGGPFGTTARPGGSSGAGSWVIRDGGHDMFDGGNIVKYLAACLVFRYPRDASGCSLHKDISCSFRSTPVWPLWFIIPSHVNLKGFLGRKAKINDCNFKLLKHRSTVKNDV